MTFSYRSRSRSYSLAVLPQNFQIHKFWVKDRNTHSMFTQIYITTFSGFNNFDPILGRFSLMPPVTPQDMSFILRTLVVLETVSM